MTIATGMKAITQGIVSSHEDRMKRIAEIRGEAQDMIKSFEDSRQETNRNLRRDLARDKAGMGAEVRAMRNGFRTSHKEMGLALHQGLAKHTQSVRGQVAKMRQEIGASHQDMSTKLKKDLAQGMRARKSEVKGLRNGFQATHNKIGIQLRKDLASYDHGIKSAVSGMLRETRDDLGEARSSWQELASTIIQVKSGGAVLPESEAKMLAAVNEHPEGVALAGIADSLGVAPVVLGRAVKSLVGKGEIRKEEKLYFPVGAE